MRALVLCSCALALSCASPEDEFTRGRGEDLCKDALPVCQYHAGCVLDEDDYLSGQFPGARRVIVETEVEHVTLEVRFLLTELVYPGTELLVQAYGVGCGDVEQVHLVDVDLFHRAGDDGTLTFELPLEGKGDHLVEIYSDMSAGWLMKISQEWE